MMMVEKRMRKGRKIVTLQTSMTLFTSMFDERMTWKCILCFTGSRKIVHWSCDLKANDCRFETQSAPLIEKVFNQRWMRKTDEEGFLWILVNFFSDESSRSSSDNSEIVGRRIGYQIENGRRQRKKNWAGDFATIPGSVPTSFYSPLHTFRHFLFQLTCYHSNAIALWVPHSLHTYICKSFSLIKLTPVDGCMDEGWNKKGSQRKKGKNFVAKKRGEKVGGGDKLVLSKKCSLQLTTA